MKFLGITKRRVPKTSLTSCVPSIQPGADTVKGDGLKCFLSGLIPEAGHIPTIPIHPTLESARTHMVSFTHICTHTFSHMCTHPHTHTYFVDLMDTG